MTKLYLARDDDRLKNTYLYTSMPTWFPNYGHYCDESVIECGCSGICCNADSLYLVNNFTMLEPGECIELTSGIKFMKGKVIK